MGKMKWSLVGTTGQSNPGYDVVVLDIPLTAEQRSTIARFTGKNLNSLALSSSELRIITGMTMAGKVFPKVE